MKKYETIFIARQDMSPAQVESLTERFIGVLKENNATVGKTEYCGLRPLAYLIKKNSKGHYVLMNITATPAALKELERIMSISEDVLRFLSVVVEKHEEGPSALLKASRFREENSYSHGDKPRERHTPEAASESSEPTPATA